MSGAEKLLCSMTSCGTSDLKLLDRVGYDWREIVAQLNLPDGILDFNRLLWCVVNVGIVHLKKAIKNRICELEESMELNEDESKELEALKHLDPDKDIRGDFNFLATHLWIVHNGNIYQQYLSNAIEDFENNVGINLVNQECL